MNLLTPIKIGNVELKNRIVMPSMTLCFTEGGFIDDRSIDWYVARAKGGVGMICVEDGIVDFPNGNNAINPVGVSDDKYIPMLAKLAKAIKDAGSVPAIQLSHAGRRSGPLSKKGYLEVTRGALPVAPSMIGHPRPGYIVPRELTVTEIHDMVEKFRQGARRCREAGFEIIGLHCAHMYLCGQFLSPWANKRTDEYGGSLENRMRFVLEVIEAMKEEIGDIPLYCRMNGYEPDGGNTLEEIREIARRLEAAGVQAISVSCGYGPVERVRNVISTEAPIGTPEGVLLPYTENIKAGVSVPVMIGNQVRDPEFMEKLISEGKADMITLGRPLITDPDWVNKVAEGRPEDIRPCVSCCQGCIGSGMKGNSITCILNPQAGHETDPEFQITTAPVRKKVLVIGAGPAGLESAIVAHDRGHDVTIWEKSGEIGGSINIAKLPPRKDAFNKILRYFKHNIEKRGIKVEFGKTADLDSVREFAPDSLIIAAGGKDFVPPIKGIDGKNVHSFRDVFVNGIDAENVVVLGGGQVGIELAEWLGERGVHVTIVDLLPSVGGDMFPAVKEPIMFKLEDYGTTILTETKTLEIDDKGLTIMRNGKEYRLPADAVVVSTGMHTQPELEEQYRDIVPEDCSVGDTIVNQGDIMSAVHSAFKAAIKI